MKEGGGNLNAKFNDFREKYPEFIYHGYEYQLNQHEIFIKYNFEICNLSKFEPTWKIDRKSTEAFDEKTLENLIFNLGMVELISYWKLTCSKKVTIKCGFLDENMKNWWYKLYKLGLGEFLYLNNIDIDAHLMDFNVLSSNKFEKNTLNSNLKNLKTLVPIGGGKDSAVSIELLKNHAELTCFIINPRKATLDTYKKSEISNILLAKRTIDQRLIDLNSQGFLNGHTPFSAIVAFASVICAYINGLKYVALSNESSANEATVVGTTVNHQYSKSFEFEQDFINYENDFIGSNVNYFSLLRPLTELKIAEIFSKNTQYHDIFRSCNAGSKTDIWCANCPKCMFVYTILAPFLSKEQLISIFSEDLFDKIELLTDFRKLVGLENEKPFECVGSVDEVNASIQHVLKFYDKNQNLPCLLEHYVANYKGSQYNLQDFLDIFDENNAIPSIFENIFD